MNAIGRYAHRARRLAGVELPIFSGGGYSDRAPFCKQAVEEAGSECQRPEVGVPAVAFSGVASVTALCEGAGSLCGRRLSFGAALTALTSLVYGAGGNLRGTAEAEDHAGEDGEGRDPLKRRNSARAD